MNIKTKLISGFLGIAACFGLAGIINLNTTLNTQKRFDELEKTTIPKLLEIERSKNSFLRLLTEAYSLALIEGESGPYNSLPSQIAQSDTEERLEWLEAGKRLESSLNKLSRLSDEAERKYFYKQLINIRYELEELCVEILDLKHSSEITAEEILLKQEELEVLEESFISKLDVLVTEELKEIHRETKAAELKEALIHAANTGSILSVVVLASIFGINLANKLIKRILKLDRLTTEIMSDCLDTRLRLNSGDELGVLENKLNLMAKELKDSMIRKSNFYQILNLLDEPLIVVNKDGAIVNVNSAVMNLTGYPKEKLIGCPIQLLLPRKDTLEYLNSFFHEPKPNSRHQQTVLIAKDEREIFIDLRAVRLEMNSHQTQEIICLIQDKSALINQKKQLLDNSKAVVIG